MKERIHKRLPAEFVGEVFESFNSHKISENEAVQLLGIKRAQLYRLRQRWLKCNGKQPFVLWQRNGSAFHVISSEVKEWLDKELRYIRQQAETCGKSEGSSISHSWRKKQRRYSAGALTATVSVFMH